MEGIPNTTNFPSSCLGGGENEHTPVLRKLIKAEALTFHACSQVLLVGRGHPGSAAGVPAMTQPALKLQNMSLCPAQPPVSPGLRSNAGLFHAAPRGSGACIPPLPRPHLPSSWWGLPSPGQPRAFLRAGLFQEGQQVTSACSCHVTAPAHGRHFLTGSRGSSTKQNSLCVCHTF